MSVGQTLTHGQHILFTAAKRALANGRDIVEVRRAMRAEVREATRGLGAAVREKMLADAVAVMELLEAQSKAVPS